MKKQNQPEWQSVPRNKILVGDALANLKQLPSASIDTVVTSPPYWGLRDYGVNGQIGLESSIDGWVRELLAVIDEIHRVLVPGGTFWLNVGDTYSNSPREGAAKKSLLAGPQRLTIAMLQRGWLLRNHVIWRKTSGKPESVRDRLANKHEAVLFFSKHRHYFFDLDAIREPHASRPRKPRLEIAEWPPRAATPDSRRGGGTNNKGLASLHRSGMAGHPLGKNPGDVWDIATSSYRGAHFATFPPALVHRPILASTPRRICANCRTPWRNQEQLVDGRRLRTGQLTPQCACNAEWVKGLVLDPFMGSGTTAIAAEALGRDWLGIELNPAYADLARERVTLWREKNNPNNKGENHGNKH